MKTRTPISQYPHDPTLESFAGYLVKGRVGVRLGLIEERNAKPMQVKGMNVAGTNSDPREAYFRYRLKKAVKERTARNTGALSWSLE
jgi:hypothetical protein